MPPLSYPALSPAPSFGTSLCPQVDPPDTETWPSPPMPDEHRTTWRRTCHVQPPPKQHLACLTTPPRTCVSGGSSLAVVPHSGVIQNSLLRAQHSHRRHRSCSGVRREEEEHKTQAGSGQLGARVQRCSTASMKAATSGRQKDSSSAAGLAVISPGWPPLHSPLYILPSRCPQPRTLDAHTLSWRRPSNWTLAPQTSLPADKPDIIPPTVAPGVVQQQQQQQHAPAHLAKWEVLYGGRATLGCQTQHSDLARAADAGQRSHIVQNRRPITDSKHPSFQADGQQLLARQWHLLMSGPAAWLLLLRLLRLLLATHPAAPLLLCADSAHCRQWLLRRPGVPEQGFQGQREQAAAVPAKAGGASLPQKVQPLTEPRYEVPNIECRRPGRKAVTLNAHLAGAASQKV